MTFSKNNLMIKKKSYNNQYNYIQFNVECVIECSCGQRCEDVWFDFRPTNS